MRICSLGDSRWVPVGFGSIRLPTPTKLRKSRKLKKLSDRAQNFRVASKSIQETITGDLGSKYCSREAPGATP